MKNTQQKEITKLKKIIQQNRIQKTMNKKL